LKKAVNDRYRLLEIDLDGVFQRLLLLQKKKYAAVKVEDGFRTSTEVKGLDMKRREYCALSKTVSQYVLDQILSGEATENVVERIHEYLTTIGEDIRGGKIKLDEFIIFKRLGKNPEDYPDAKSLPHVQVALRMKTRNLTVRSGDVIPYIFCAGEADVTGNSAQAERARHPDELRKAGSETQAGLYSPSLGFAYRLIILVLFLQTTSITLHIRFCRQSSVFVIRLKELTVLVSPSVWVCPSTYSLEQPLDVMQGLDPGRYRAVTANEVEERRFNALDSQLPDVERYKDAAPFIVRCRACECRVGFAPVANGSVRLVPMLVRPHASFIDISRSPWSRPKESRARCAIKAMGRRACRSSSNARSENIFTSTTRAGPSVTTRPVEIVRGLWECMGEDV
jgi:DNA polymerase alpha subunit A